MGDQNRISETSQPLSVPVLVAHVKHGFEDRRRSIERQFRDLGIPFEFMLDGDIPDIDAEMSARWFDPRFPLGPAQSCACKHLLMYERIVKAGWEGALILEDDIFLLEGFAPAFEASLQELRRQDGAVLGAAWISYENTGHVVPPRQEMKQGQMLYRSTTTRCTGAYYIGFAAASALLHEASTRKVDKPIDCWVEDMVPILPDRLQIYWCHPAIAEQGSMNGRFDSMDSRRRAGVWRSFKWKVDKLYKSFLARFR